MIITYSAIETPNPITHQNVSRYRAPRTFNAAETVVTAAAGTSVSAAEVELQHAAFEVTALRVVRHAIGLVIIRGGFVFHIQFPSSCITF